MKGHGQSTRWKFLAWLKIHHHMECTLEIWKRTSNGSNVIAKVKGLRNVGHGQDHKVIDLSFIWKGFGSGVYMPNMKSLSLTIPMLLQRLIFFRYVSERSLYRTFNLSANCWHAQKSFITRILHDSTSNGSTIMTKVKVFRNVGQRSRSRSRGHQPRWHLKGLQYLSIYAKYEVPTIYG